MNILSIDCGVDIVWSAREKCIPGITGFMVLSNGGNRQVHKYMKEGVKDGLTMVSLGYNGDTRRKRFSASRRVKKGFIKDVEATGFWWESLLRLMANWFQDLVVIGDLDFSFFFKKIEI